MKTIYHISIAEYDFFFDAKGEHLAHWYLNDADYRNEYMDTLMESLGIKVEGAEWDDERFKKQVVKILVNDGTIKSEDDLPCTNS